MSRRALQIVLAMLATVAIASGLAGMVFGPAALPSASPVDATVDSEYRFANAFWFAAGVVVWWAIPRVEQATVVLRVVLGTVFIGGIARLVAAAASGWPHPVFVAALGVELIVVPILLVWQGSIAKQSISDT